MGRAKGLTRLDIWTLAYRAAVKVSGKTDVEFVFSGDYKRLKQRVDYFCKKHKIQSIADLEKGCVVVGVKNKEGVKHK